MLRCRRETCCSRSAKGGTWISPVILPERDYSRWLDVDSPQLPIDLFRPYEAEQMTAWKVDKRIGNVRNDTPDLLQEQSAAPEEPSLFKDTPI